MPFQLYATKHMHGARLQHIFCSFFMLTIITILTMEIVIFQSLWIMLGASREAKAEPATRYPFA